MSRLFYFQSNILLMSLEMQQMMAKILGFLLLLSDTQIEFWPPAFDLPNLGCCSNLGN